MSNIVNTDLIQSPPVYNFYFADELNVSQQRKDSRSSSCKSQKHKIQFQQQKNDTILEDTKNQTRHVQQSLLEGIEQNQFITGYAQKKKNAKSSIFKNQHALFHENIQHQEDISASIQNLQLQNDNQTSFLLDSDTYKQICIEEHSKKVEFISNINVKSFASLQDMCELHQKPFDIVCIEDKTLVCSHCAIFGDHKTHCLAPIKQIQKCIQSKKNQVNDIISNYKILQLGIKHKSFVQQFTKAINKKKGDMKQSVELLFKKVKQFICNYQNQLNEQLQKFYNALQNKLIDSVKRTSLDSNTAAFQRWQRDAVTIMKEINFDTVTKKNRVNLFLNNFSIPEYISNEKTQNTLNSVSLEIQGQKYLNQIKQQLNLNINNVMKTVQKFNINLNDDYQNKIKSFINFDCQFKINDILQENNLQLIENRLITLKTFDSVKQSMKYINETSKSISVKFQQPQLASTVVSMTQSTPIDFILKSSKKLNSPMKKHQSNKEQTPKVQPNSGTIKKSLKYRRQQTLEDMKKLQQNLRHSKSPAINILEARSQCNQTSQKKRRISPCLKDMPTLQYQRVFTSTMNSRVNRCKSRDAPTHGRSPSDLQKKVDGKDFKRKNQITSQNSDPLKILQTFQKSQGQTLDLSNCNLNDTEILYFLQKASKIRKIKHLKLASNMLTSQGLQKILPYLSNCNLINLSNNKLSQTTVDLLLKKKQKISQLRMLNLSNNKLNQRKIKQKIAQFKKMNVVVTL